MDKHNMDQGPWAGRAPMGKYGQPFTTLGREWWRSLACDKEIQLWIVSVNLD